MHDIYKQKCLVKSIYLVLQIKHCKKVRSSIGFKLTQNLTNLSYLKLVQDPPGLGAL